MAAHQKSARFICKLQAETPSRKSVWLIFISFSSKKTNSSLFKTILQGKLNKFHQMEVQQSGMFLLDPIYCNVRGQLSNSCRRHDTLHLIPLKGVEKAFFLSQNGLF